MSLGLLKKMTRSFAPTSLLLGNFVIGTSVLAPTGMLNELSASFGVSIRQASLLVTFGAVVMCIGSPLLAWWTSRIDRRLLLGSSLALVTLGHLASAFASSFAMLLTLRLLMLAAAAPFTPQAASSVQVLVPEARRASAIAYVFLGWALSTAVGIPIITHLAHAYGWQGAYAWLAAVDSVGCALVFWRCTSSRAGAALWPRRGCFTPCGAAPATSPWWHTSPTLLRAVGT
jgi:predicted MFS family arabinose efflux permease